jgi:lipopolysaccharide transport system ATP-binding protein
MPTPIITVENLGKRYSIGHQRLKGDGLRHTIEEAVRHPLAWLKRQDRERRAGEQEFWALKDVSFEVQEGEVVGIIGRNGAGKSTLLKILSRITEPTQGRVRLRGRVASLLEVGTGFHQELTGRENIFLNGAILGMTRAEIRSKFDEIVAFSEVELFLDTPVKRYSSGMYVRLAFAVAAHLEPEILIVDEVLAVGDVAFQRKCLGKMRDVATGGRTVLFVSHNMQAVSILCGRGLVLDQGALVFAGGAREAIDVYLSGAAQAAGWQDSDRRLGSGDYRYTSAAAGRAQFTVAEEKSVVFEFRRRKQKVGRIWLSAHIVDSNGNVVTQCDSRLVGTLFDDCERMAGRFRFTTPWLKPGSYRVDLAICASGILVDFFEGACRLAVSPVLPYAHSLSDDGTRLGLVFSEFSWERCESGTDDALQDGAVKHMSAIRERH